MTERPYIYIYTSPLVLGLEKNKKMAGVYNFSVYMQIAPKYNTFYIQRPRGGVYTICCILGQLAYTPRNCIHQPFSYFF